MNWKKHIFHWGKWNQSIGDSVHNAECFDKKGLENIYS